MNPSGFHGLRTACCWMVCALLVPCTLSAQVVLTGPFTTPESGVEFRLVGAYDNLPTHGFVPMEVEIRNDSGRTRTWKFEFSASTHHLAMVQHGYTWDATVPNGAQRTFDVMVPMSGRYNPRYTHPGLNISAQGFGVQWHHGSYFGSATHSGIPALTLIGMTPGLSVDFFGPMQSELVGRGKDVRMAALLPDRMSADWRAYTGIESIWLTEKEWQEMGEPVRQALWTWVLQGGRLVFASPGGRAFPLPTPAVQHQDHWLYGLGTVHVRDLDRFRSELQESVSLMETLDGGGWPSRFIELYGRNWAMAPNVEQSARQVGFLVVLLFGFAIVVGPVNLLWLAGRTRRWRLFITTPLISLVASLLLALGILLQDGLGGRGTRVSFVLLAPELRQMLLVQEQSARTGLLLRREFALSSDHFFHRLDNPHLRRQSPLNLQRDERSAGGDWFSSRQSQAHLVSTVLPSRARIELLNADAAAQGREAPRLLSTIETELASLYYVDPHGKVWVGENLRAGESQTLEPAPGGERYAQTWWARHVGQPGIRVHPRLNTLRTRPGHVAALAKPGTGRFIETLPSIRWENRAQVFVGPCVPTGGISE